MAANKRDTGRPAGKNVSRQLWPRGDVKARAIVDFQRRIIYQKQGNFVEAGQMCRRTLEGFREVLGSNHPCIIRAANNLLPWFGVYSILSWNLLLVNHVYTRMANLDLDQFKTQSSSLHRIPTQVWK